jgi:hypothetical protein
MNIIIIIIIVNYICRNINAFSETLLNLIMTVTSHKNI